MPTESVLDEDESPSLALQYGSAPDDAVEMLSLYMLYSEVQDKVLECNICSSKVLKLTCQFEFLVPFGDAAEMCTPLQLVIPRVVVFDPVNRPIFTQVLTSIAKSSGRRDIAFAMTEPSDNFYPGSYIGQGGFCYDVDLLNREVLNRTTFCRDRADARVVLDVSGTTSNAVSLPMVQEKMSEVRERDDELISVYIPNQLLSSTWTIVAFVKRNATTSVKLPRCKLAMKIGVEIALGFWDFNAKLYRMLGGFEITSRNVSRWTDKDLEKIRKVTARYRPNRFDGVAIADQPVVSSEEIIECTIIEG